MWALRSKIYFYKKQFLKISMWGPKGWFWYFLIMIPKAISFHAVVVLVLVFSVLFRLPLTMLWMNLLYFASMYFRSGTFKTSYLPKGYFMYLRQKMWVQVKIPHNNYKKLLSAVQVKTSLKIRTARFWFRCSVMS